MKSKLRSKLNEKTIGVGIILLTALYLLVSTVLAQGDTKTAETGITYNKEYLSYGDVWAFDSATHGQSNYRRNYDGSFSMHTDKSNTKNYNRYFYSTVTTNGYSDPTGTTMVTQAFIRFNSNQTKQATVSSPVNDGLTIPVMEATANNALYSVVPDTVGDYYVYAYSETGAPTTMFYSMLNSPEASNAHTGAGTVTSTLNFEEVGNNWYRAKITVDTVRWHAVQLNCEQKTGSHTNVNNVTGGKDPGMELNNPTYYNSWSTSPVYYNTVIIFKFSPNVKLGPITKTGDTLTISNSDTNKGDVSAKTIFGEEIAIGTAVTMPHCPVIISGEAKGAYMLNEVLVKNGSGQLSASGNAYVYPFEDTSMIEVTWTKLVNLPNIAVSDGLSDLTTMNFFGAKTAEFEHPGGQDITYTFTADFDDAKDLGSLSYSYKFNGTEKGSGTLTEENNSFSFSNVCYDSVVVTFTATDKDGDTYTATCTITLPAPKAESAPFKVGNNYYWTWEKAVGAAASGSNKTVVLVNNYTLPNSLHGNGMLGNGTYVTESGGRINYRLPNGVTFIAPYNATGTSVNNSSHKHPYANENQGAQGHWHDPVAVDRYVYRELTVSPGASINLESNSTLAVGGSTDGSCTIYGDANSTHSNIHLETNSEINVKSGARLSSCGYIYGEGTVTAESGSTVYMPFSALDFRGGGYTVGVAGKMDSSYGISPHKSGESYLSPFVRYCMNAIQAKLTLKPGATVTAYLDMSADGDHNNTNATIIGSGGLIQTTNATIEITYDPDTYASITTVGKTKIKIDGDASFGNLRLSVSTSLGNATIDTNKVNFPIPYNYDIEIASGTFSVPYAIMLLPGSSVTVDEGATLDVTNSLTVYDGLHDYTIYPSDSAVALSGWEQGSGNPNSNSAITNAQAETSFRYPSTAVLQSASFGGSGSADLIVNGTLNLNSGTKFGGIIQTGSSGSARINTVSDITTSTTTQIGAVGSYSVPLKGSYYFAGATVRTMTGEILDTTTGNRTKIVGGKTYYPSAGVGNISSYKYTLYYDSASKNTELTEEVACILQGSWYNYTVNVHTVKDGVILETTSMRFAHGADASRFYTNLACTTKATTVTGTADLYFDVKDAEAKIVWANGDNESYYMLVRSAVQAAVHAGDRIVQLKDLTDFSSVIGPIEGQDFIFDMNGKTINYRSTPFTSMGGKLTVDVNGGMITNRVSGKYYDSPVLMLSEPEYTLVLLLNGGTISVTGTAANPLVNGGVENAGNLTIDLGGGTWEYKTGLKIKTKTDPEKPATTHDLSPLTSYRSKAMFNNTGTLTIKDSVGYGTIVTDLIQDATTITSTAASQTSTYTSVIRNHAGATLILGGGTLKMEIPTDENGNPVTNNAATPVPISLYSAVILNFGELRTCEEGTALSMQCSGSHCLYNFFGSTVDLDLRGGTVALTPYTGEGFSTATYNGKAPIVNDGVMTLRNGKVLSGVSTTTGVCYGVRNSTQTNGTIKATLTLDGIDIETTQTLNNLSYALYNANGSTITEIKNTNVKAALGYAFKGEGSAAIPSTIGSITNSTFESGTTEEVKGTHAFYTDFTSIGNISGSTFKNESNATNMTAFRVTGGATLPITVGNITDSHIEGAVYGFSAAYANIGAISNSTFSSGTNYALSVTYGSSIESITGGSIKSTASGGLTLGSLPAAATNEAIAAHVGNITGVEFDVQTVGITAAGSQVTAFGAGVGPEIGNITNCTFHTNTGNGITITGAGVHATLGAAAAPTVGDIIENNFDTGAYGISISGAAGNAAFPENAFATVGDFKGNTVKSKTVGIYLSYANAGVIENCEMTSTALGNTLGVIHVINRSSVERIEDTKITFDSVSTNNSAAGIYTSSSTIGDIILCEIRANSKGYAISHNATAALGVSTIGDITDCTIVSGVGGISATSSAATATADAAAPVIGNITDTSFETVTYGINIVGVAANTLGKAAAPTVGNITDCTFTAGTSGINIAGGAESAAFPGHAFATVGDITDTSINAGTYYGIYLSYANAGKIESCMVENAATANSIGTIHVTNRSSVDCIQHTDITVRETSTNTSVAGIYTSASTIGDIIHCKITASKGPAISHNATAALGVSTIGDITNCTIVSGAGGISAAGGGATASLPAAAPVFGNITGTTFETVTYGMNIVGVSANAYGAAAAPTVGDITNCTINAGTYGINIGGGAVHATGGAAAGPTVGKIADCTINAVTYGIQIAGSAGTLANNYTDAGFAKVDDITGTAVNSGIYSLCLSYCKGGVVENCELNAVSPASTAGVNFALGNLYGSEITRIVNTSIKVTSPAAKVYGVYNNGGKIGLIEKSPIDAPCGIYNANTRSSTSTATSGEFVVYAGHIGTIKDTDITVAQYAIANRGVIDEIIGKCTFIAANPSAQVPSDTARYANSNAPGYTIYNYNTWWADQTLWRRTDTTDSEGRLTRTDEYLWDDDHRPTIGKISGDIQIIALNTGGGNNAQNNGCALVNNGVIREISGNVVIETYVHPDNNGTSGATPPAYSAYALQNIAGGRIDKITGNVKISAGAYAIQNTSASTSATTGYAKTITTYAGTTVADAQMTSFVREYHWDYTGIGEITGDKNGTGIIIEATYGSYALENHAHIGNITGKVSITADNGAYALQNTTLTAYVEYTYSWPGLDPDNPKTHHEKLLTATIGTIGGSDSEVLIRSANSANNTYTLHNNGRIEAIVNVPIETTVGNATTPTIYNAEASYTVKDSVYTNLGYNEVKSWYDTAITRGYVYERSSIGKIDGVTVTTARGYALRNAGDIGSITNSSFTAATGYGIDNILGGYAQADGETYSRGTAHYYHGATALTASTPYFGESTIWYTRKQATIGLIDNVTITVEGGNFGIQNAGIIDKITNSTITVSGTDAIGNTVQALTDEDVSMMEDYIYLNAGSYAVSATAAITDKVWTYELPKINWIGGGNTIQAAAKAIENKGIIGAIGDENGERTTITATSQTGSNQQAIYNYDGFVSRAERDNSTTTVNTYANATIGTIKNVSVSNGITPAIQNGASSANYYPVIEEIGEGTEVHSVAGMAVSNYTNNGATNNAKILKITGGIFTTDATGNFYALYNYSTVNPIEISGGYFKSGTGDRAHAIYLPDDAARYTYPEDMFLSKGTVDVTFADGSTGTGYYFVAENKIYIIFDGNGASEGEMDQYGISLADLTAAITLPENGFGNRGFEFDGWAVDQYAGEALLGDQWTGTVAELQELLGQVNAGDVITLYAVWSTDDATTYTIVWGDMNFVYTEPHYIWNPQTTEYELKEGTGCWSTEEGANTITVITGKDAYDAKLTFAPTPGYDLGMYFIDEADERLEDSAFTASANATTVIYAMLTGDPEAFDGEREVGTITIELTPTKPTS